MPRTITGSYILRPNTYLGYFSSGTFTNYFEALSVGSGAIASGGYPAGGWTNQFSSHGNTVLGDQSDSTYLTVSPPHLCLVGLTTARGGMHTTN